MIDGEATEGPPGAALGPNRMSCAPLVVPIGDISLRGLSRRLLSLPRAREV